MKHECCCPPDGRNAGCKFHGVESSIGEQRGENVIEFEVMKGISRKNLRSRNSDSREVGKPHGASSNYGRDYDKEK